MRTSSRAGVRLEKIPDSALSQNKGKQAAFSVETMDRNNDFTAGFADRQADNANFALPTLKN